MKQSPLIIYRPLHFFLLLFLLISCTSSSSTPPPTTLPAVTEAPSLPQQNEGVMVEETAVFPINTATPTSQAPTFTPTAIATITPSPTPTVTPSPTPASTPTPSLAELAPACEENNSLPSKAYPSNTYIGSYSTAVNYPYMYLTTGKHIGMIDISDPVEPQILGYWELPIASEIIELKVHNGVAYVVNSIDSHTTVHMLNLSPNCRFAPIATIELSLNYSSGIQLEGDRLYIGEYSVAEEIAQISIFSIDTPTQPVKLGDAELKQYTTSWSVFEEHIYSVTLTPKVSRDSPIESALFNTDISTPQTNHVQLSNISELIPSSTIGMILVKDKLYVFSNADGLTIISNLQEEPSIIKHSSQGHPTSFVFDVQGKYAFFGGYTHAPYMNVFDGETAKELFHLDFSDGYVTKYQKIQEDIDYAFTNSALLVMDVSSPTNPIVVNQISLMPWSE